MRNIPPGLEHLKTWSPVGDTVWGGLGGAASLEEKRHWARLFELKASPY